MGNSQRYTHYENRLEFYRCSFVVIGWGVSVEVRMSRSASLNSIQEGIDSLKSAHEANTKRLQNIEKLDYNVRKEVEEKMSKMKIPAPTPVPTLPALPKVTQTPEMFQKWAEQAIQEGQKVQR